MAVSSAGRDTSHLLSIFPVSGAESMIGLSRGAVFLKNLRVLAVLFPLSFSVFSTPARAQANRKAEELYSKTEYKASLELLDKDSRDAGVENLIGRNYFMMGDFKKAVDFFCSAATIDPSNSDYALWLGRAWGRRAETSNSFTGCRVMHRRRGAGLKKQSGRNSRNQEALSDLFDYYLETARVSWRRL